MTGCIDCGRGLCVECVICEIDPCHIAPVASSKTLQGVGRPLKNPDEMLDPKSTGRKRAAKLYPIFEEEPCEWRKQKNCGGGLYPIVGCLSGMQRHRHHGPIKDPRHNEPGNVSRICETCHNRWHARNDPEYDAAKFATLPHKPELATEEELAANEMWWRMNKNERKYIESSTNS